MIKSTVDLIKEHLSFNCSICFQDYNSTNHYPYEICINSHSVCKHCLQNHLQKSRNPKCPQCRQTIKSSSLKKYPKRLTNQIISTIQQVKKRDDEVLKKIQQIQWISQDRLNQLVQKIVENKTILNQNIELSSELEATVNQLTQKNSHLSYFYHQNISLQKQFQQKKQQNTRIKLILIYIIVTIFYLIFFDQVLVDHSQHLSSNNFFIDSNQQSSLYQMEIKLALENSSLQVQYKLDEKMLQLFSDQEQKINLLTQEISTIQKTKQQQLQKIRTFLKTKYQLLQTQLLTKIQNSKSLKDFQKIFENLTQYKKQFINVYQDKKYLFNAQVQRNEQLLKAIKQTWTQIMIQSKKSNLMENLL